MCLDPKLETLNSGNDWAPSNTMNGSNIASNLRKKTHGAIFQSNFPIEMATLRYTDYPHLSLSGQTLFSTRTPFRTLQRGTRRPGWMRLFLCLRRLLDSPAVCFVQKPSHIQRFTVFACCVQTTNSRFELNSIRGKPMKNMTSRNRCQKSQIPSIFDQILEFFFPPHIPPSRSHIKP